MTDGAEPPATRRQRLRTGRLEAFSDGVFAIAITLLVLDLAVPLNAKNDLLGAVASLAIALFYILPIRRSYWAVLFRRPMRRS